MPSPRHTIGSWPGCFAYAIPIVGIGRRNLLKRGVVGGRGKQRESTDSMVEHMMGKVSGDLYWVSLPKQERTDYCYLILANFPDLLIAKQRRKCPGKQARKE
jgi:hypothetical protein